MDTHEADVCTAMQTRITQEEQIVRCMDDRALYSHFRELCLQGDYNRVEVLYRHMGTRRRSWITCFDLAVAAVHGNDERILILLADNQHGYILSALIYAERQHLHTFIHNVLRQM